MTIRQKTVKGHSYWYEQKSVRQGGKVKTLHVRYLGKFLITTSRPGGYLREELGPLRSYTVTSQKWDASLFTRQQAEARAKSTQGKILGAKIREATPEEIELVRHYGVGPR